MAKSHVVALVLTGVLACVLTACSAAPQAPESESTPTAETATVAGSTEAPEPEESPQPTYMRVPNVTADTMQEAVTALEDEGFSVVTVSDWSS